MPTHIQLWNNSGVEAVDNQAHSAAFTRKSAEFLAISQAVNRSSQGTIPGGFISMGLCFQTQRSAGPGVQLWLQFRYTSKLAAVCVTKFTLGYMAFGNATREQPVASCHQAAINTIKKLLRSYSQKLRDHLLLIKYS